MCTICWLKGAHFATEKIFHFNVPWFFKSLCSPPCRKFMKRFKGKRTFDKIRVILHVQLVRKAASKLPILSFMEIAFLFLVVMKYADLNITITAYKMTETLSDVDLKSLKILNEIHRFSTKVKEGPLIIPYQWRFLGYDEINFFNF